MGKTLDPNCQVVRYASGRMVLNDRSGVTGEAFKPRQSDQGLLSVNRLGVFGDDLADDIAHIRVIADAWMTIRKTGGLAQIAGESIVTVLAEAETSFLLEDDPRAEEGKPDDPSHALIHGIPAGEDDGAIATRDMISLKVSKLHEAKLD